MSDGVVVVRRGVAFETPQGLPYRVGVSGSVCGSAGVSLRYDHRRDRCEAHRAKAAAARLLDDGLGEPAAEPAGAGAGAHVQAFHLADAAPQVAEGDAAAAGREQDPGVDGGRVGELTLEV